ncbi:MULTISPECIES: DUF3099 domain-containing protein [Bacteria]|uniref:DUF3099 domain-containing protein n=1 Tax=Bacteria TaxID=2 RepID=UPI003C7AC821
MRKTANAPSVTSLPRAPQDEARGRVRHYIITMGIRVACFLLMVLVQPYGWYTWVFGIAAAVLPYVAVVFANAGDDSVPTVAETPAQELAPPVEPAVEAGTTTITLRESGVLPPSTHDEPTP